MQLRACLFGAQMCILCISFAMFIPKDLVFFTVHPSSAFADDVLVIESEITAKLRVHSKKPGSGIEEFAEDDVKQYGEPM